MEIRPIPWVDFSINKKCRDFDKLIQFNLERSVDKVKFDAMPKPENVYIYPGPWIKHEVELGVKLGLKTQKGVPPINGTHAATLHDLEGPEWETH
jgi:hypothetical protein